MAKKSYDHTEIEPAAQKKWEQLGLTVSDLSDTSRDPYYLLVEFPYPSGDLHVGHWYAFAVTDIFARFKRMSGFNVLFPFGFDAFGLPAENAAIKRGLDPKKWTYENMEHMRAQVRTMGTSLDWSKEVVTCDPDYYRWTQWLFAQFYKHGLAERRNAAVKWCPKDLTVLANEQVIDGHCDRCGTEVEEKNLTQWFLTITKYADRLIKDLEPLPWKEEIKDAQRAWIGESHGAVLPFKIVIGNAENKEEVKVFTTRPDTLYGATYLVLAPEHPWITNALKNSPEALTNEQEIRAYIDATARKTERERMENKDKTGVLVGGVVAINPATKKEIPVYIADYVLASYGTGAVMAVPAHDERDFIFAKKFDLPMVQVIPKTFTDTTGIGAYRPQEPTLEKHGVVAIIKHWKEEKYLGLKWKKVDWGTFLTGGVDEGMTPEETVLKEIQEETGFTNAKIVKKVGVFDSLFYHVPKEKNQLVHGHIFYIELADGNQEELSAEEKEKHDMVWLTAEELPSFLTPDAHKYALDLMANGYDVITGSGALINSDPLNGKDSSSAFDAVVAIAGGEKKTNYRLRDWLVSRQRYWGCPIPVVYDPEGTAHLVPDEHLPWLLPEDVDFTPGKYASPLASSVELKERVTRLFGEGWTPECDTFDTFVDSSWYFTRYLTPVSKDGFSDSALMKKWLPVDRYAGGAEHTTLHLLYSRFFYKALFDLGLAPTAEPFNERYNRGLIMGPDGQKMSKSKGNVVNPDEYVQKYGADAVRTYLAFIGPYNEPGNYPWKPEGVESMRRFLDRVYALSEKVIEDPASHEEQVVIARASHKMGGDIERFKSNTAVSAFMILMNELEKQEVLSRAGFENVLVLIAPFAPHLAEHLFEQLPGITGSVHERAWPVPDKSLLENELVTIGVQVAGKRRGEIEISPSATQEEAVYAALAIEPILSALPGGKPTKIIYREGKILNLIP